MSSTAVRPPLNALLRVAWQQARRRMLADLRTGGFAELDEAHLHLFQHPGPDGLRPSDLARRLRTSRQATNYLLAQLESMGYLQRRRAAGDVRRRVYVTARGRRLQAAMLTSVRRFERQWRRRVGAARYRAFLHVLGAMAAGSPRAS